MRLLQTPTADMKGLTIVAPILKGGTGADNSTEAVQNLGGINAAFLGQANGVAQLNALGKLDLESFPAMVMVGPTLNGPTTIYTGQTVNYTITNYDINTVYDISASVGTVNRVDDTLTYTAPGTVATLILSVNSKTVTLPIVATIPNAPEIVSPVDGSIGLSSSVVITASAFSMNTGSDTHQSSDWQIATDNGFSNIVSSVTNDTVNKLSWTANGLAANTDYYVRVRYKGTAYGYGSWSETISFTTKLSFIPSTETAILSASDKAANDSFGYSVSISSDGTRVAIGAYAADPNSLSNAGKAYIFSRSGTSWTQEAILTASDKAADDQFGVSVSITGDGTRVAIGAQLADPFSISDAGKVYIFSRSGTSWTEEAILTASDKAANDKFGYKVSTSSDGTRVAIGAYTSSSGSVTMCGKAYIFSRSGTSWTEEAILSAGDKVLYDYFGTSISISSDGSRVAIGAQSADPNSLTDAGKAYIFSRSGTSWTEEAILTASDKAASDLFGYSVSISSDGTRVAIGAYAADPNSLTDAGKAYIFSRSGTSWTEEAILTASDKAASDSFGFSVSISSDGTRVAIGAYGADPNSVSFAGKAYIFSRSGTSWTEEAILTASDKAASDQFAKTLCISSDGSKIVIGAPTADPFSISDAGKAYIFS